MNDHYEIQSIKNPKFGATIYPYNIHRGGSGYFMYRVSDMKPMSPNEVRDVAGSAVMNELRDECKLLHYKTNHDS